MRIIILFIFLLLSISINAQIINTIAGTIGNAGNGGNGGLAINATLDWPSEMVLDKNGNLFIAENSSEYAVRKIDKNGIISIFAGNGLSGLSGDGGLAIAAKASYSRGIACDKKGNIYFSTSGRIRKIDTAGIITSIAGGGTNNLDGIDALQAMLPYAGALSFDAKQNLYFLEITRLRKIDSSGLVHTIAGSLSVAGYSGDGGLAVNSTLKEPAGFAFDKKGNIYIADQGNNVIRKIDTAGIINTIAGTGTCGISAGDGGLAINATFCQPYGIAVDTIGNIFFVDGVNSRIRKIDTAGIISTYAGGGNSSADGIPAINAVLQNPLGLLLDSASNLYIADAGNNIVRKISPSILPVTLIDYRLQLTDLNGGSALRQTQDDRVVNYWITAMEINVSHFNVQRSTNGKDFTTVGKVSANNKPSEYRFTDDRLPLTAGEATLYYKLEMVDMDGTKTYSSIQHVNLSKNQELSISPNPAKDKITIAAKNMQQIHIINSMGQGDIRQAQGDNRIGNCTLNIQQLRKGLYLVQVITTGGEMKTGKLVVE